MGGHDEREQTLNQLLVEMDGFQVNEGIIILAATNRKDILDPAITRPGRLERKINVPVPTKEGRREILKIHTRTMDTAKVDMCKVVEKTEGFTGADIKAVCTEAGYFAIRAERFYVETSDFLRAVEKVKRKEEEEGKEYVTMFG